MVRKVNAPNLKYEDANFTKDDEGCMKSVFGVIDNVQLRPEKSEQHMRILILRQIIQ